MHTTIFCLILATCPTILIGSERTVEEEQMARYITVPHTYDLKTTAAITDYLPARLKALMNYFNQNEIEATRTWIEHDPDLDSFLFILEAHEPYRMLAYSRSPELFNKTPQELQKLLLPNHPEQKYSLTRSIKEIVSITREITTYTGYWWKAPIGNKPQRYIAYTTQVSADGTSYILGATLPHARVEAHIILPQRVNQVIARINREGLMHVASTINKNLDYGYFFIIDLKYPYRFITHRQPWAGLTPQQARTLFAPACDSPDCDLVEIVNGLIRVAQEGVGYHVYLWRSKPEEEPTLKITYLKPFTYKKNKYLIGTGLPADVTAEQAQQLEQFVKDALELIKKVGFDNALSEMRHINTPDKYVYVDEATAPYRSVLNANPDLEGKTAEETQRYVTSSCGKKAPMNMEAMIKQTSAHTTKSGGGFQAYEFLAEPQNPGAGITLKVSYVLPFTHNQHPYFIGTGIPIERALHLS